MALRKSRYAVATRRVSDSTALPAPTGGMNARDSLALMEPDHAIQLINLFPQQYGCRVRKGWVRHVTGFTLPVETLMSYSSLDGVESMFAVSGDSLYDATTFGPVGTALFTGFTNARWQHAQMVNQFGNFLSAVNGADLPIKYDGTTWSLAALTVRVGETLNLRDLIHVAHIHRRLWFVEKGSGNAWYLPIDQIEGELSRFGVGEVFRDGGFLQAIDSWSTDSGTGMQERTVFVGSQGNVAVFDGFDPDVAGEFTLSGVYKIGSPVGRRCTRKYGSDLLILCEDGVIALSSVLAQSRVLLAPPLSDIVQQRLSEDIGLYKPNFGWEMVLYNRYQFLIVNIPMDAQRKQYVMNSVTSAWCEFVGYDALCWERLDEEPYFGGPTYVGRAWYGYLDDFDMELNKGTAIEAQCLQAFNYFGSPSIQKHWTMARPIFNAAAAPAVQAVMNTDFDMDDDQPTPTAFVQEVNDAVWDTALWDEAPWPSITLQSFTEWFSLNDVGFAGALYLKTATSADTFWVATDFNYESGGIL
jgi:hypothetical protein